MRVINECLLADAQVLAPQGAVSVVGLQPGFELRSRRGHVAVIRSAAVVPAKEMPVVSLLFGMSGTIPECSVTLPSSLPVMAKKSGQTVYRPMHASTLRRRDVVRTVKYEMAVAAVEHDMVVEATVEACFEDVNCGFFIGMPEVDSCQLIEACCA